MSGVGVGSDPDGAMSERGSEREVPTSIEPPSEPYV